MQVDQLDANGEDAGGEGLALVGVGTRSMVNGAPVTDPLSTTTGIERSTAPARAPAACRGERAGSSNPMAVSPGPEADNDWSKPETLDRQG